MYVKRKRLLLQTKKEEVVKLRMLPLEEIRKFYPNASEEELKEIQEVAYLLACAVMQHFYGSEWMGGFEESDQEGK